MANVLITGGSGYLGGDLLDYLNTSSPLPHHGTIFALVRSEEQGEKVKKHYNATPLVLDLSSQDDVTTKLVENKISIVFFLVDAFKSDSQVKLLHGLSAVSKEHDLPTYFLHTSGAKLFSAFTGHPVDRVLRDDEDDLFNIQRTAVPQFDMMKIATTTNCTVIELGKELGVKTFIFAPCIVYSASTTFGNKISIQTQAIVKAAKANKKVVKPDTLNGTWPVCHVRDNSMLYAQLLIGILSGKDIPNGRHGYYLASPGSVAWSDIYAATAQAMHKRGVVDSAVVGEPDEESLKLAGKALDCPPEQVSLQMGGICTFKAVNGPKIGWKAERPAEHILQAMDDEVELILKHI